MKIPSTKHSARREFGSAGSGKLTGIWRMNKKFKRVKAEKPKGPRHQKSR
jgi:hypothetical protein